MRFHHSLGECSKFESLENLLHFFQIDVLTFQLFEGNVDRYIRLDGDEEFREFDLLLVFFHFLLLSTFQLVGVLQKIIDRTKLLD